MKKIYTFVVLILVAALPCCVLAQIPTGPASIQSPNVASLGLYGEVPISKFTGTPNISIPLYNLKSKSINLPLGLSYHASGFRPDQHPDWVGQGWTLQAGGVISRVVRDMPDDYDNATWNLDSRDQSVSPAATYTSTFGHAGYYWNCSIRGLGSRTRI